MEIWSVEDGGLETMVVKWINFDDLVLKDICNFDNLILEFSIYLIIFLVKILMQGDLLNERYGL